jgi:putative hydrolase of the HAD superfamily
MPAIGFDLGGTLIRHPGVPLNWQTHYAAALQRAAEACGVDPSERSLADAADRLSAWNTRLHPRTTEVTAATVFGPILLQWSADEARLDAAIDSFFGFFASFEQADPDASEVLTTLRHRGYRIGILSDVAYGMPRRLLEQSLTDAGLLALADVVITSVDVGFRKPHPEGYWHMAREFRADPGQMLYVGDEPKDVAGAIAAGMRGVMYAPVEVPDCGQWRTIRSLGELLMWEELGGV